MIGSLVLLQACGPKKTISTPDQAIREGWTQYRLSEFNSAIRIFQSVQASQPAGSDFHLQALYGEASCWNHRRDGRDIAKAVAAYRAVSTKHRKVPWLPGVRLTSLGHGTSPRRINRSTTED